MDVYLETVDLAALAGEVRAIVEPLAVQNGNRLTIEGAAQAGTLRTDGTKLKQSLINLLGNAAKFTKDGDIRLSLSRERTPAGGDEIRFVVSDTGIGMTAEQQAGLFQPFSQADGSTTRKYGGTGLGLTICRRLLEAMGGAIGLSSAPGAGSTFWFEIPLIAAQSCPPAATDGGALHGRRVLIVDDHPVNREILEHNLDAWNARHTSVADAAGALRALLQAAAAGEPFDLVLLDFNMPLIDGLTLSRRIQDDPALRDIPRVLLSSAGTFDAATRREAGIAAAVEKPVRPAQLLEIAHALLDGAQRPAPIQAAGPMHGKPPDLRGRRLLLVEDNEVNEAVALALLGPLGAPIDVARNGLEALAAMRAERYDMVLMDCQMPKLDGFEATRRRRAEESAGAARCTIIAMTANAMSGDPQRCMDAGMDDYLSKPVHRQRLYETLARWHERLAARPPGDPPAEVSDTPVVITLQAPAPATSEPEDASVILALPVPEAPAIDPAVFEQLRAALGDAWQRVADLYLQTTPGVMAAIQAAGRDADAGALRLNAHSLKSSSASLGAMRLSEIARELEAMARRGAIDGWAPLGARLDAEYERVRAEFERLGAGKPARAAGAGA